MTPISKLHFSVLIKSTANDIQEAGAASVSDALESNTTIAGLNLECEDKRSFACHRSTIHYSVLIKSTGNEIGDAGVTSLSEALKSNTTLTELYLDCWRKRNNTRIKSINKPQFFILIKFNRQ